MSNSILTSTERFIRRRKKSRLIVMKGMENIALRLEEIVLMYAQNKMVYVVDRYSKKYISGTTLAHLEDELDTTIFFRANRQYIINIDYIRSFKQHERVKLLVQTTIPEIDHLIIVSQEKAPAFRKWMNEA